MPLPLVPVAITSATFGLGILKAMSTVGFWLVGRALFYLAIWKFIYLGFAFILFGFTVWTLIETSLFSNFAFWLAHTVLDFALDLTNTFVGDLPDLSNPVSILSSSSLVAAVQLADVLRITDLLAAFFVALPLWFAIRFVRFIATSLV